MTAEYWYPRLNPDGSWSPARRVGDDPVADVLPMVMPSAGDVIGYLKRSGLVSGGVSLVKPPRLVAPAEPAQPVFYADHRGGPPDDPRFEWVEITGWNDARSKWIKGRCNHLAPVAVDVMTGELVAWWCPDCGDQFEPDRWTVPDGLWVPLPEINRPSVPAGRIAHTVTVLPAARGYQVTRRRKPWPVRAASAYWTWNLRAWNGLKRHPAVGLPLLVALYVIEITVLVMVE